MKLNDQVKQIKIQYSNYVILIKRGTFYVAYNDDATILNYLLDYQISDNKIGFPIASLEKVLNKLQENMINVYLQDSNVIKKEYSVNNYQEVLKVAKRNYFNESNANMLLEEISFFLKSNPDNINKIRTFINEL